VGASPTPAQNIACGEFRVSTLYITYEDMAINPTNRYLPNHPNPEQLKIIAEVNDWFGEMDREEKRMAKHIAIYLMGRRISLIPEEKEIVWHIRQNRKNYDSL